jgi:hypothetical protein
MSYLTISCNHGSNKYSTFNVFLYTITLVGDFFYSEITHQSDCLQKHIVSTVLITTVITADCQMSNIITLSVCFHTIYNKG